MFGFLPLILSLFFVFLAQILIAPRFVFWNASPDLIFAFFVASFLFLKNKKFVFVSALTAGVFAAFPSLLPAPAFIFAFSVLALVLFLSEKLLDESAKKIFVLGAAFPLSFIYKISILIFIFTAGKIPPYFGFPSLIGGESGLNFEIIFTRPALAQALFNFAVVIFFYGTLNLFARRRLKR